MGVTRHDVRDVIEISAIAVLLGLASPFIFVYCRCTDKPTNFQVPMIKRWYQARCDRKKARTPIPPPRRALTLPLPPLSSPGCLSRIGKQRTKDQLQSVLFGRLPLELRELIFEYALSGFTHIHIFRRTYRQVDHYKCHSSHRAHQLQTASAPRSWIPVMCKDDEVQALLPLLTTCRRM